MNAENFKRITVSIGNNNFLRNFCLGSMCCKLFRVVADGAKGLHVIKLRPVMLTSYLFTFWKKITKGRILVM